MPANAWDGMEYAILAATREPATARQVADLASLTPDMAQAQLEVLQREGLLAQSIHGGVRYQLTLTGWKRLSALTTRPGHPAAA